MPLPEYTRPNSATKVVLIVVAVVFAFCALIVFIAAVEATSRDATNCFDRVDRLIALGHTQEAAAEVRTCR